ncbi:hypothetical protein DYQ86_10755 [Acidobacteria bacterium AB60]|nr:hypothetical protein DYQ86_10755 [Acidobacteria bacterium AB60]
MGASPLNLTVTTLADSLSSCTGTGSSLNCPTLRTAIEQANTASGSTIQFQQGLTGTIYLTSALPTITQDMTVTGPGANTLSISGGLVYEILTVASGTVSISGLTFANGNGPSGGAIFNAGTLTIENSAFSGNYSAHGGAIDTYGVTTITNTTFDGNSGYLGGGAIYSSAPLTVISSTFSGNSAIPAGLGFGGGAIDSVSTLSVSDSTFSGNSTGVLGGAIASGGSPVTINNNIFVGNTLTSTVSTLGSSIFSSQGNADRNLYYQNVNGSGAEYDCNACATNTNAITGKNPNLFPLGYYGGPTQTMLPQPGSPAICAGSISDVPSGVITDQRGYALASTNCSNGDVDIGAVQSNYIQVTNTSDSGAGSLRAAMAAADATTYGGDINIGSGVAGTISLASPLPGINRSMAIVGPGAGALTISGEGSYQIFSNSASDLFLTGMTLANGNSSSTPHGGGAVYNGWILTASAVDFSGNLGNTNSGGGAGGAIDNNGLLAITNCTFSANSSIGAGAIQTYGIATVTSSLFTANIGVYAGGAIVNGGATTVINSTFTGNSAPSSGGGSGGGAIESFGQSVVVTNSTFSGNSTSGWGGAIWNFNGSTLTANNNIFIGNTSTNTNSNLGAAIAATGGANASYNLYYQNFDAGTTEDDCNGCTGNTNAITASDPLLEPLGNFGGPTQTMLPKPGSPAICAGTTGLVPSDVSTDQRGFSRTTNYNGSVCVDLGAVQTDYTVAAFSNSSYSALVGQVVTPPVLVTVTENGQNVGGVPLTLGYSGTGSPTGLGPVSTIAGVGASFNVTSLSVAHGTLSVNLPITASGNPVQPAALSASATVDFHGPSQTITFVTASPITYGSAPVILSATGGASGNPVTFSLDLASTKGAAVLNGNKLTITGAGSVVIDANQAAGGVYPAAPQVQQTIVVNPAILTITASSPTVVYSAPVPAITPVFGAFVDGESSAVLTNQPTCGTTYTTTSPVGSSPSTSCSGAAAANYAFAYVPGSVTILAPPSFVITSGGASISIAPGATTGNTVAISVTPSNGFTGPVNLTCSMSPVAANDPATCSLSPSSVTITGSGSQNATLAISTTAPTAAAKHPKSLLWPSAGAVLAAVLMIGVPRRPRGWATTLGVLALLIAGCTIGCGGGGGGGGNGGGNPGTTAGTYKVTVTGTSGGLTSTSGTITVTVQ